MKHVERVLHVAIKYNGLTISGYRHTDCFKVLNTLKPDYEESKLTRNLFLTSFNRLIDREEAWIIAKAQDQITYGCKKDKPEGEKNELISEHLYWDPDEI